MAQKIKHQLKFAVWGSKELLFGLFACRKYVMPLPNDLIFGKAKVFRTDRYENRPKSFGVS
jgi:hypothetical protein